MQTYIIIRDFHQRLNKKGTPYGWPICVCSTPEVLWGYDHIASAYSLDPAASRAQIVAQMKKNFPEALDLEIDTVLG